MASKLVYRKVEWANMADVFVGNNKQRVSQKTRKEEL